MLEENARARRCYERAGFTATSERKVDEHIGGAAELRYALTLPR